MSRRWAVRLKRTEIESLKTLRLVDGAEICEQDGDIWVRGAALDENLAHLLRKHPHARRYWVRPDNQLLGPGKLVPGGYLPAGPWNPLRDSLTVTLPVAAFAGLFECPMQVQLVRASVERDSNVMVTSIANWSAYGAGAPRVRLDRWFFAAAADGRVVVRGAPLPPLPGQQFVEENGIGVPVGWTWHPEVGSDVLRSVFQIEDQDLVLLCKDNTHERVRGNCFVRASRSAIRVTAREFGNG